MYHVVKLSDTSYMYQLSLDRSGEFDQSAESYSCHILTVVVEGLVTYYL